MTKPTARPMLLGCESCGLVSAAAALDDPRLVQECPRCGHALMPTKPHALQRTWAFVLAAAVLYIPANALPVMVTTQALQRDEHTLLGGIHELWLDGSWGLAVIVFIASIAVPVLKIAVLGLLAWTVRHKPHWRRLERARLYRLVEAVGHWSMLDVYVVALLVGLVRFRGIAEVLPGPGIAAFGAVVVLTLLSSISLDPRLIWDTRDADRA